MVCFSFSVLENKNSGPYLFFQRQFWSSVKVCICRVSKRLQIWLTLYIFEKYLYIYTYYKVSILQNNFISIVYLGLMFPQEKMNSEFQSKVQASQQNALLNHSLLKK